MSKEIYKNIHRTENYDFRIVLSFKWDFRFFAFVSFLLPLLEEVKECHCFVPLDGKLHLTSSFCFALFSLLIYMCCSQLCSHCGWLLLKCSAIGIGFNGAETNCRIAHILGILLMNSCNTDRFLATTVVYGLSTLNHLSQPRCKNGHNWHNAWVNAPAMHKHPIQGSKSTFGCFMLC